MHPHSSFQFCPVSQEFHAARSISASFVLLTRLGHAERADRVFAKPLFIHVEPYVAERARQGELVPAPAMVEWGLPSDTWLFVIDQEGRVAGKFEAIASVEEVEPVLRQVLGESAG